MLSRLGVTAVVEQWSRGAFLFVSAKYSRNLNVVRILANRNKKLSYQVMKERETERQGKEEEAEGVGEEK